MSESRFIRKATEVRVLVSMLAKHSIQALEARLQEAGIDLGPLQFGILRRLLARDSTNRDLSNEFMLSPSTLVPAVVSLEQKGFVARHQDPADGRRQILTITEQGRELISEVPYLAEDDPLARGLKLLDDKNLDILLGHLKNLLRQIPDGEEITKSLEHSLEERTVKESLDERR